jgi:hypothetical protein
LFRHATKKTCLGECLQSLVNQSEDIFELGKDWELIVVDDHSTDRTAEIARGFAGVTVMEADKLEPGWTGKNNAVWTAARRARGRWLLFTDADTMHEPGDLRRAMHEAERHKVGMLSYSPRQIVQRLAQRSLMPLVFCELALAYPPAKVSDPAQRIAAANGQFLLVEREAYRKLGGHASVAGKVLEDVELAFWPSAARWACASAMPTMRLRAHVPQHGAMIEGWTKNLKLLFNNALMLAVSAALDFLLLFGLPILAYELVERAAGRARPRVAGRGMDSGRSGCARSSGSIHGWPSRTFLPGLRAFAAGSAAVCGAALSQLVPAPHPEARKLEGTELSHGAKARPSGRERPAGFSIPRKFTFDCEAFALRASLK